MSNKSFNVTLTQQSGPARVETVEARNAPEAKRFAEGRYPGYTARAANT